MASYREAKFYDADLPRLVRALEKIAEELEKSNSREPAPDNSNIPPLKRKMLELMENGNPFPWAVFEKDDALLENAEENEDFLEVFIKTLFEEMDSDGDMFKEMRKFLATYRHADDNYRAVMDGVFCALCGWSIPTLLEKASGKYDEEDQGDDDDDDLDLHEFTLRFMLGDEITHEDESLFLKDAAEAWKDVSLGVIEDFGPAFSADYVSVVDAEDDVTILWKNSFGEKGSDYNGVTSGITAVIEKCLKEV